MGRRSVTLIDEERLVSVEAVVTGGDIRLGAADLENALGWKLEPQGLCRGGTCVPIRDRAALVHPDGIDLAAFAQLLDRPLALDVEQGAAALGASADVRAARLASMEAPDFALPDLSGRLHALRDQRGKKTLLIAWASW